MKLEINKFYEIWELIELIKKKFDREFYDNGKEKYIAENKYSIYISENNKLKENTLIYVGKPVEIDDNDNEIYPNVVLKNNLEFYYSCETLQDVIDLAFSQKSEASIEEIIKCLNFYSDNDTFLDLK